MCSNKSFKNKKQIKQAEFQLHILIFHQNTGLLKNIALAKVSVQILPQIQKSILE